MKLKQLCFLVTIFVKFSLFAQPIISSFSPTTGPVGTSVTIVGSNFNPVAANNIVYFGGMKALVTSASTTSLNVIVPYGSNTAPVTVTSNQLTAYSKQAFVTTFATINKAITNNSFENQSKISYPLTSFSESKSADFDNDGKIDFATAVGDSLILHKNTTIGKSITFSSKKIRTIDNSVLPYAAVDIACGDFDGDGKVDIAVTNYVANSTIATGRVSLMRNISTIGNILFEKSVELETGIEPRSIEINDLNNDGKPDIAVSNLTSKTISIFKNTTVGPTFAYDTKVDFATLGVPIDINISQIDDDQNPDIIITDNLNNISVYRNVTTTGQIAFTTRIDFSSFSSSSGSPGRIKAGDLNKDGKIDFSFLTFNGYILQLRNESIGSNINLSFGIQQYVGNRIVAALEMCDLNGDSFQDLLTTQWYAIPNDFAEVVLVENKYAVNNNWGFSNTNIILPTTAAATIEMQSSDFDNDGKVDFLVFGSSGSEIYIFRNRFNEPFITSFTPTNATTGNIVTIKGGNFLGATQVSFGGTIASSFTVVDSATITANVGTAGSGNIMVTTPQGTATLSGFVHTAPVIGSFTPT
ncbi:MAG: FG-GAP-like repeat-containing protein, partial [Dolichospermum sp.]